MSEFKSLHVDTGKFFSGVAENSVYIIYSGVYRREFQADWPTSGNWGSSRFDERTIPIAQGLHTPHHPSREQLLVNELRSYLDLPNDWDGYGAIAPTRSAVLDAMRFLNMRPEGIQLPYCEIASDGEVGFYWKTKEVFAEVGFYGDNLYTFYGDCVSQDGEKHEVGGDHCSLAIEHWDSNLILLLSKI